jgi:hypothetical protein
MGVVRPVGRDRPARRRRPGDVCRTDGVLAAPEGVGRRLVRGIERTEHVDDRRVGLGGQALCRHVEAQDTQREPAVARRGEHPARGRGLTDHQHADRPIPPVRVPGEHLCRGFVRRLGQHQQIGCPQCLAPGRLPAEQHRSCQAVVPATARRLGVHPPPLVGRELGKRGLDGVHRPQPARRDRRRVVLEADQIDP